MRLHILLHTGKQKHTAVRNNDLKNLIRVFRTDIIIYAEKVKNHSEYGLFKETVLMDGSFFLEKCFTLKKALLFGKT